MMTDMVNNKKEINEAIVAGDMALNSLYAAQEKLDSAKGWSWLDMFGGGLSGAVEDRGCQKTGFGCN